MYSSSTSSATPSCWSISSAGCSKYSTRLLRGTEQFHKAEANNRLITIPTGDGMALVFYNTPEAPVECALEISRALKEHPELKLRMGVHSGAVSGVVDVSGRANIAGAGINVAQRVMDCGDTGHILLSKHVAEDLEQLRPLEEASARSGRGRGETRFTCFGGEPLHGGAW